jgi:DNA-binding CsgD family transcriptional regulator
MAPSGSFQRRDDPLNWRAVAVRLADRAGEHVLVDPTLTVRLVSSGLERRLGWPRDAIEGRALADVIVPPVHRETATMRMRRALEGTLPAFEIHAVARDDAAVILSIETSLLGSGEGSALLMTVTAVRSDTHAPDDEGDELAYDVDVSEDNFGALTNLLKPRTASWSAGDTCYRVLYGLTDPCADCPLRQPSTNPWPRTLARAVGDRSDLYEVVSATLKDGYARVRRRRIAGAVLTLIQDAKLKVLAQAANLSERESQVLHLLLLGRSLADIGFVMGISLRTVKFHQANILEKLGVDSRADLVRLLI